MVTIEQIAARVQSVGAMGITITDYARRKGIERRIDVERACQNILARKDGSWSFSSFKGTKGIRVVVSFRVSPRKEHKYILEVNKEIYLINVIDINSRKQSRLRRHGSQII